MNYVGLDVHKKWCYGTLTDEEGNILRQARFNSDREGVNAFMRGVEEATVALESGYCWQPIYEALEELGYDARLAHPKMVESIAGSKRKNDRIDSEKLAHLLRAGLLPESYVPPREIRVLRDIVRRRSFMVGVRTMLKNRVHAELTRRGLDPGTPLFTRKGRELLAGYGIEGVDQLLPLIDALNVQINAVSGDLLRLSGLDERAQLLMTIPGVGYYIAMLIVSEIGDVNRFRSAERLCSYAGLVPSVRSSGEKTRLCGITREGSTWLRWAVIEAVHVHNRFDTELSRFHRRLMVRMRPQEAAVASARKMLKVIWWMLRTGEPYHPEGLNTKGLL